MRGAAADATFEQAFDDLFARARSVARRILGDRQAAEDVAAEALARTYARWHRLEHEPWRDGWVLRVTANLALDVARRRPPPIRPVTDPDIEDQAAIRLTLVAALHALPKRQREVIVLRYLTGFAEAEVAASLGISPGSVKTHMHRGMAALRNHLGEQIEEEVTRGFEA
jgi:RNA polymerase sigma-70 factor (sigma-E family)